MNDTALTTLKGNTHPLAQAQFDRGAAPPDLPMARMLLVLKRSDAQDTALEKFLDDQQDRSSPSYHQWLTPDQFGQQFGSSDQDIQAVTLWLRSHGFQIGQVGRGRTVIEFSGTALQVQQAFHAEIHKFTVNGEDHWANASDPQIPAALSPVIVGVASLHNFPHEPNHRIAGVFSKDKATGQVQQLDSDFTTVDGSICRLSGSSHYCYFVGPYDFAKIYNVSPLWTAGIDGTGQSIAIVSESNINIQDVRDFRNLFGLPANDPQIFLNGPDPGLVRGPETEVLLDVEWAGAVAKAATIKLVVSPPTNSTEGADLAGLYAVENNLAPIVSESYGDCEFFLGAAGNSFESAIRQQAAAQGITYINSSGDEGSARCDPVQTTPPAPATHGLMVSGLASTPYGVAVGGTDFLNFGSYNLGSRSPYWKTSNDLQQASAIGYVPETTWNNSCTNPVFAYLGYGSTPEATCNNPQLSIRVHTIAGGGGKSNCTTSDQTIVSSCTGGYSKPSWQAAPGVPTDNARDIPDVSLFSGNGFMDSAYIVCEADRLPVPQSCTLSTPYTTFLGVGGTSAAAPSFAGIMALVNQYMHASGQGNANYTLYRLASSALQTSNNCGATASPSSTCIFNDVTSGGNAVPCYPGTLNCNPTAGGDLYGVLPGYSAGAGYDQATGLGSVNAYNLVHSWNLPATPSSVTLSLTPTTFTHGQSVGYSITVTPGAATGDVSLIGSPTGTGSDGMALFTLQNGTASGTTTALAGSGGKAYQVRAHYAGDSNYAASDSKAVTVTVSAEPSKPVIWISTPVVPSNPSSVTYGTAISGYAGVGNAQATATIPPQPVCALLTCPTGTVILSDTLNAGPPTLLSPSAGFPLNISGITQDFSFVPAGGTHVISANYAGDNSYLAGSGSYSLTVTPAATGMSFNFDGFEYVLGSPVSLSTRVFGAFSGVAPTGTITFTDGTTPISGTVSYTNFGVTLIGSITTTFATVGRHNVTMTYSGDANYQPTSGVARGLVLYPTTASASISPMTINAGQSATITATATTSGKTPGFQLSSTFQFSGSSYLCSPCQVTTPSLSLDANGNQVLTATSIITPTAYGLNLPVTAAYFGGYNFESGNATVSLTVGPPDFTLGASVPSLTISAGQNGSTTLTVTPQGNVPSSVTLSCDATAVAGATCSFIPSSTVNLNGTAATTTLMVTTLPPSTNPITSFVAIRGPKAGYMPSPGLWLLGVVDGIVIVFLSLSPGRKQRHLATSLGMVGLLLLAVSCTSGGGYGGGGGPSPTSLTLSTSTVKVQSGTNVTFTAKVNSTSANAATGTLTFLDAGSSLGTANVTAGMGTLSTSSLSIGTHVITAHYSGDSYYLASSTNGAINQTITGISQVKVQGTTSTLTHTMSVSVTIQ